MFALFVKNIDVTFNFNLECPRSSLASLQCLLAHSLTRSLSLVGHIYFIPEPET